MPKRKPIDQYETVYYKYTKDNVEAHRRNPEWYPQVNTEGMCLGRHSATILKVKWDKFDEPKLIEEHRVGVRRKNESRVV